MTKCFCWLMCTKSLRTCVGDLWSLLQKRYSWQQHSQTPCHNSKPFTLSGFYPCVGGLLKEMIYWNRNTALLCSFDTPEPPHQLRALCILHTMNRVHGDSIYPMQYFICNTQQVFFCRTKLRIKTLYRFIYCLKEKLPLIDGFRIPRKTLFKILLSSKSSPG